MIFKSYTKKFLQNSLKFKNLQKFRFSSLNNKDDNKSLFNERGFENNRTANSQEAFLDQSEDKDFSIEKSYQNLQFSKAPILENFGELKTGEIPEPLKYSRPFKMTTLPNGVRVCTESWPSLTCAVGVFVNAGSRYETPETSGSAHFLEHILFKGTKARYY